MSLFLSISVVAMISIVVGAMGFYSQHVSNSVPPDKNAKQDSGGTEPVNAKERWAHLLADARGHLSQYSTSLPGSQQDLGTVSGAAPAMPLQPRAYSDYWEGSGLGHGDLQLSMELPTLGLTLSYNSTLAYNRTGLLSEFGSSWRLDIGYFTRSGGDYNYHSLDGYRLRYAPDGDEANTWRPVDRTVRDKVKRNGSYLELYHGEGQLYRYLNIAGLGKFRLVAEIENGRTLRTVAYHSDGRIKSITDLYGAIANFSYDGLGRVEHITNPRGGSYRFTYDDAQHNLLMLEFPDGRSSVLDYVSDLVTFFVAPGYYPMAVDYYELGIVKRAISAAETVDYTYSADLVSRVGEKTSLHEHFSDGQLIASTQNNLTTTYTRYAENKRIQTLRTPLREEYHLEYYSDEFRAGLPKKITLRNPGTSGEWRREYVYNNNGEIITEDDYGPNASGTVALLLRNTFVRNSADQLTQVNPQAFGVPTAGAYLRIDRYPSGVISKVWSSLDGTVNKKVSEETYSPNGDLLTSIDYVTGESNTFEHPSLFFTRVTDGRSGTVLEATRDSFGAPITVANIRRGTAQGRRNATAMEHFQQEYVTGLNGTELTKNISLTHIGPRHFQVDTSLTISNGNSIAIASLFDETARANVNWSSDRPTNVARGGNTYAQLYGLLAVDSGSAIGGPGGCMEKNAPKTDGSPSGCPDDEPLSEPSSGGNEETVDSFGGGGCNAAVSLCRK